MADGKASRATQFRRAADGSMTLIEHFRELRGRLFKASLGLVAGTAVGLVLASRVWTFLTKPYCDFQLSANHAAACTFSAGGGPLDLFLVNLKVGLYFGIMIGAPVWLYQLWAFIAPGLHRRERRFTYVFVMIAAPLFAAGVVLAHLIVSKSLRFFLTSGGHFAVIVDINGYFSFVTKMMLLFGIAFEFPLVLVMLNFTRVVSGRRLLGWWRPAIFLMFLFGAIVTPTPDPFAMSVLAGCLAVLYFAAVAVALVNDRRKGRRALYAGVDDDAASSIDFGDSEPVAVAVGEPVSASGPVSVSEPVSASGSPAVDRWYDDDAT